MTKELLDRLPEKVRTHIDYLKSDYQDKNSNIANYEFIARTGIKEYVRGLYHAGIINDTERKALYCYMTV